MVGKESKTNRKKTKVWRIKRRNEKDVLKRKS